MSGLSRLDFQEYSIAMQRTTWGGRANRSTPEKSVWALLTGGLGTRIKERSCAWCKFQTLMTETNIDYESPDTIKVPVLMRSGNRCPVLQRDTHLFNDRIAQTQAKNDWVSAPSSPVEFGVPLADMGSCSAGTSKKHCRHLHRPTAEMGTGIKSCQSFYLTPMFHLSRLHDAACVLT